MDDIDSIKVRASRDGHQFHEHWAARTALSLLAPNTTLKAISLEGFSVEDKVGQAAVEVADLVMYIGNPEHPEEEHVKVAQFKYSPTAPDAELMASDLAGTLTKFLKAKEDFEESRGTDWVAQRLSFEFVSNRPIGGNLKDAIKSISDGTPALGRVATQYDTLRQAFGEDLSAADTVLSKLTIVGQGESVGSLRSQTQRSLASWFGASGAMAQRSLLELCDLVRSKAGMAGVRDKVINKTDILGCLKIDDEDELFPITQAFPDVAEIVERDCFLEIEKVIREGSGPFLIHGSGGSGKTVLMQSLARRLGNDGLVILFDGFGGGRWRMPGDDRHQSRRSLLHIVNCLAAQGLCDLMLPGEDEATVVRTTRKRLVQSVQSLRRSEPGHNIYLILDAIDHAGIQAAAQHERSFAELIINGLQVDPIDGVTVIASCRTERMQQAVGDAELRCVAVPPLSPDEALGLARRLDATVTASEAQVIYSRSMGNPRCLDAMVEGGRPFDLYNHSQSSTDEVLDKLLEERFQRAIAAATLRGTARDRVQRLLHAVALLPPPVPVDELAGAIGYAVTEIESFFSDLFPLIEITSQGLIFRDEPTETLAIKLASGDQAVVSDVVDRLEKRQTESSYATRALPSLLLHHRRIDQLVNLAFSDQFPASLASKVAKRGVRLSRLASATIGAIEYDRRDDLFALVVELARVSGGTSRTDKLVRDFPELTAVSGDVEALRRVYEQKAGWAGERFGAMAVASLFSGELGEAERNANRAVDWLNWAARQNDRKQSDLDRDFIRSLFVFLLQGAGDKIIKWLDQRDAHAAFFFFSELLELLNRSVGLDARGSTVREKLIGKAAGPKKYPTWFYAAILSFVPCDEQQQRAVIRQMSKHASSTAEEPESSWHVEWRQRLALVDAILSAAVVGVHLGEASDAGRLVSMVSVPRPREYEFGENRFYDRGIGRWIVFCAVKAALSEMPVPYADSLPRELWQVLPKTVLRKGDKAVCDRCAEALKHDPRKKGKSRFDYETTQRLRRIVNEQSPKIGELIAMSHEIILSAKPAVAEIVVAVANKVGTLSSNNYDRSAAYLSEHAWWSVLTVVDSLRAWDQRSAQAVSSFAQGMPGQSPSKLIWLIRSLSRCVDAQPEALALAAFAREMIGRNAEAEIRIQQIALLAQSLWDISPSESGLRFREALELADLIGSDSQDTISVLISLLGRYQGDEFDGTAVQQLLRLCELNLPYDTDKFDWDGLACALARISNLSGIRFLTQLVDRDKLTLGWALPSYLSFLVEQGKLSAASAAALVGADRVAESYNWSMADFATLVVPKLAAPQASLLLDWLFVELDRAYGNSPYIERVERLIAVFSPVVGPTQTLELMEERVALAKFKDKDRHAVAASRSKEENTATAFDVDDLDDLLHENQQRLGRKDVSASTLMALANRTRTVSEALEAIDAIANSEMAVLSDKLYGLDEVNKRWAANSIAVTKALEETANRLVELHASELVGSDWMAAHSFRKLALLSPRKASVVRSLIQTLRGSLEQFNPWDWLRCAFWLVDETRVDTFRLSLTRFAALSTVDLPAAPGEKAIDNDVSEESEARIVASFVWHQLGSPHAEARWRAAHIIRRFCEQGNWNLLGDLLESYRSSTSSCFGDINLPFYPLHARLWFLIAIDRVATDHPEMLSSLASELERLMTATPYHALLRSTLFSILSKIKASAPSAELETFLALQATLLHPIGYSKRQPGSHRLDSYRGRPTGEPRGEDHVALDYDFEKYDVDHLGRIFGVDTWQVSEDVAAEIRKLDPHVGNMRVCPRGLGRYENRDRFSDGYGAYLGWHALQIVADRYLRTKPVEVDEWGGYSWDEWLARYGLPTDTMWTSDLTDPFPNDVPSLTLDLSDPRADTNSTERSALAAYCLLPQGGLRANDSFLLAAQWEAENETTVKLSSALIQNNDANCFANALALIDSTFQYIPRYDDRFGSWGNEHRVEFLFHPLDEIIHVEKRIDDGDPLGISTSLSRAKPTEFFQSLLGINETPLMERHWIDNSGQEALSQEFWGARQGRKRHQTEESGFRVTMPKARLCRALAGQGLSLVVLVQADRYLKDWGNQGGAISRRSAVVVLNGNGEFKPVQRIPSAARDVFKSMASDDRTDIHKVYKAILKTRGT